MLRTRPIVIQSSAECVLPRSPDDHDSVCRRDAGDELVAPRTGDLAVRPERRQPTASDGARFGLDDPARVGEQRRLDHLVAREEGLDQDPAATVARSDQAGRSHQQRHRLFAGSVTRCQQLTVEVEERDGVGPIDAVQRRLGADVDARPPGAGADPSPVTSTAGRLAAASSSSRSRVTPGRRLANRPAPHTQADRRPHRVAARAHELAVVVEHHRRVAPLATCELAALSAGQQRARPVVLLTHTTVRSGRGVERSAPTSRATASTAPRRCGRRRRRAASRARSRSCGGLVNGPHSSAVNVGHGETSSTGTSSRRHRSITTSRACHVGEPSSWSASSCSSSDDRRGERGARRPRCGPSYR